MTDSSHASIAVLSPGRYRIDPDKSQVHYSGKHMFGLGTVHATFTIRGGELRIGEPPATSGATATVDAAPTVRNVTKMSVPLGCWMSTGTRTLPLRRTVCRRLGTAGS